LAICLQSAAYFRNSSGGYIGSSFLVLVPRPPWREHYLEIWLLSNLKSVPGGYDQPIAGARVSPFPPQHETASIPPSADSHPCFFTRDPDALRVRYWHIASIRCSAVIRQQSEVNRTCHGHRRSDAAGGLLPRPICVSGYRAFSAARYTRARAFPSGSAGERASAPYSQAVGHIPYCA
jgi:hypothetical protein